LRAWPRCLLLCTALASVPAAADILDLKVKREQRRFHVQFEVQIDVPPADVLRLFHEPERWTGLSRVIHHAGFVDPASGGEANAGGSGDARPVSMVVRDCILFFCTQAEKVTLFRADAAGRLVTGTSVRGAGDFRYGRERWEIEPSANGTLLRLRAEMEPDFAVPPFIGPAVLKSLLRKLLREMERNLERSAAP